MNQIHGHEVMQMMLTSGKTYTKESLVADIIQKFGADTRFHTCSAEEMTAEQLVAFLESKGKFVPQAGGFQTAADRMCQH
ncbi:MAG TPA: YecH family metal-binding protein [Candidatus Sulfotelmatobacter sp.]|nr:YecH family metal-binding protein [Candidatus Sulfotelmatobacter sp.]